MLMYMILNRMTNTDWPRSSAPTSIEMHLDPLDAARESGFCCKVITNPDGRSSIELKDTHNYYAQVQGQMAITERKWCDFVIYTSKGISIERIRFNEEFWKNTFLPKLTSFYDNCLCPSIVSPVHLLGMKFHDFRLSDQ